MGNAFDWNGAGTFFSARNKTGTLARERSPLPRAGIERERSLGNARRSRALESNGNVSPRAECDGNVRSQRHRSLKPEITLAHTGKKQERLSTPGMVRERSFARNNPGMVARARNIPGMIDSAVTQFSIQFN